MKTLPSLALLAAVAALVVLPISFEFAISFLLVAGLTSLLIADYMKPPRFRRVPVIATPANAIATRRDAALRLAA